jgi:hypothetical protein
MTKTIWLFALLESLFNMKYLLPILLSTSFLSANPCPKVLFDGTNLDAFTLSPGAWEIENDGSMVCRMNKTVDSNGKEHIRGKGYIWTRETYEDFELSLLYKLTEGANSGVFYRANPKDPVQNGFEVQLMDNKGFQAAKKSELPPRKLNGSFYDGVAAPKDFSKPIGLWNTFHLKCKGAIITCHINGEKCFEVNVDDWDTPGKNPDGSTNKFKKPLKDFPRKGKIGFQNHGQVVWFRDVSITKL